MHSTLRLFRSNIFPSAKSGIRCMVSKTPVPIVVAHGDGIGPEIMDATLQVLDAAGANLQYRPIEIGEKLYLNGHSSGISPDAWDILRETKVFLKAPITTPTGKGYKSLNVSIRKTLGLFANVRPCITYHPFVRSSHPMMDLVIVRENEEDTYAGIEHRQTNEVYQCLKLITRPGCERIVRYAFEYAKSHNRKKVTCFVKDNIMKLTDGLFYKVFEEIGSAEYPTIERERMIVDIGAALLADRPEEFDVLVMPNLYGDIMSDIAAQISGSVGLGGSANIGENCAMFEAIHGSAPDIAGKDIANPSGLLLGAVQMLMHIHHPRTAAKVYNAWLRTLEDGIHTGDIYRETGEMPSKMKVGTKDFASAIVDRLGEKPQTLPPANYDREVNMHVASQETAHTPASKSLFPKEQKTLHGVDIFVDWDPEIGDVSILADKLSAAAKKVPSLQLRLITNRGVKVWPNGYPETFCVDHWRCRFRCFKEDGSLDQVEKQALVALQQELLNCGVDVIKTENLYLFDDNIGFSLGQGE